MVYYVAAGMAVISILIVAVGLIFFREKIIYFLVAGIVCAGFLSFYIFYSIYSYTSTPEEVTLDNSMTKASGAQITLDMQIRWNQKPVIFGFDGEDDLLVLRYNPKDVQILSSNSTMNETEAGKPSIKLSKNLKYSKIDKSEKESYFKLKDGTYNNISVTFKVLKANADVKVFYLHDYKLPFETATYWEKDDILTLGP